MKISNLNYTGEDPKLEYIGEDPNLDYIGEIQPLDNNWRKLQL